MKNNLLDLASVERVDAENGAEGVVLDDGQLDVPVVEELRLLVQDVLGQQVRHLEQINTV